MFISHLAANLWNNEHSTRISLFKRHLSNELRRKIVIEIVYADRAASRIVFRDEPRTSNWSPIHSTVGSHATVRSTNPA